MGMRCVMSVVLMAMVMVVVAMMMGVMRIHLRNRLRHPKFGHLVALDAPQAPQFAESTANPILNFVRQS